jgi:hypothetical protein
LPIGFALALTLAGGAGSLSRHGLAAGGHHGDHIAGHHAECPTPDLLKAAPTGTQAAVGCRSFTIQATADGRFILPQQVEAGRTLVTFVNEIDGDIAIEIGRLPAGTTVDDVKAALPSTSVPSWFYETVFPGSPGVIGAGGQAQAIVDLTPGNYIVFAVDAPQGATALTVVAPASGTAPVDPAASVTVSLQEFAFVTPEKLTAGKQTWKIVNGGDQPHELNLAKVPDGTTLEQIHALMTLPEGAELPEGAPDPSTFVTAGGLGFISPGLTAWAILDLQPGTYAAFCYIPDQPTGTPHAFMGMVSIFTVTA